MRISNSLKNVSVGIISQLIIAILGFVSRKVFIDNLGADYLGVNAVLTNVLSMLSLVEAGIGVSIVYYLYKPLAERDEPKIIALIQLFKKAYIVLAIIILVISLAIYPFLSSLMKGSESVAYISVAYFIFVAKNIVTFLNANKVALINADQKGYVIARINLLFQVAAMIFKIAILMATKSYILFLLLELGIYIIQTLVNGRIVNKRYPFIKVKQKYALTFSEKQGVKEKIKAMFLHNLGGYMVNGTDNLLISSFIGVATVGIYSNYAMIISLLSSLIHPIMNGIGASVGHLIAAESEEKKYSIFKVINLISFWLYSAGVIALFNLINPFISWWLGIDFVLDPLTLTVILINFYIMGVRSAVFTFKAKGGLFVEDKYVPLIGAVVNLGFSLLLLQYIGLAGVFLGTTISTLFVFWFGPLIIYKHIFNKPVVLYFYSFLSYTLLMLVLGAVTAYICYLLPDNPSLSVIILKAMICLIVPNILFALVMFRTEEFKYLKQSFKGYFLKRIKTRSVVSTER